MKKMLLLAAAVLSLFIARADLGMDNIDTFSKWYPDSNCWDIS